MFAFFSYENLTQIRYKLVIVYILNVLDIVFTQFLLNTGNFMEANPLMNHAILHNLHLPIKIIIPALLLLFVSRRMKDATFKQLRLSNILINCILLLYLLINLSHIYWYFFF